MISPPDCAPLLSRPEPRALRVQRRWEGSKQCLVSLSPSFPQPTTDSGRGPSVQHQGSALTAENKASRSKWQPSERKPDKSPQCHSGGWFPTSGHCFPFPCEGKKKKKSVQHAISLQISSHPHRAYLDGLWGRPLLITIRSSREGRSPSHTLGSHPELNVKLYKASLKQSQGQVRTHEVHPLKVDKPVPQSLPTKVPRGG